MVSLPEDFELREIEFLVEQLGSRAIHPRPGFPDCSPYDVELLTVLKDALTPPVHEPFPRLVLTRFSEPVGLS